MPYAVRYFIFFRELTINHHKYALVARYIGITMINRLFGCSEEVFLQTVVSGDINKLQKLRYSEDYLKKYYSTDDLKKYYFIPGDSPTESPKKTGLDELPCKTTVLG